MSETGENKDENKVEMGLAVQSPTMKAVEKIQAELAALTAVQDTPYKTGGKITVSSKQINLKEIDSLGKLIDLAGNVATYGKIYEAGVTALELEEYPAATLDGQPLEMVLHDIALRTKIVTFEDRRKKLESAIKTLSKHFSKEDKLAQDMADISKDLGMDISELG